MNNTLNIFVKLFLGYLGFTTILFAQNSLPPPGALFPKSNVDQRSAMPINQDRRYWEREFLEGSPQSARKLPIKIADIGSESFSKAVPKVLESYLLKIKISSIVI